MVSWKLIICPFCIITVIVALYIAEELGYPDFKSTRLMNAYSTLIYYLLVIASPICMVLAMYVLFILGLQL
jgi:hypothetical protein